MLAADKAMRALDLDMVAIYHSHPISQPIPSRKDIERNYSDHVLNLIISLKDGQPKMRAWWLTNDDFGEGQWELFDSAGV
jgi:proteasome lid subunit RPN8/RPN11